MMTSLLCEVSLWQLATKNFGNAKISNYTIRKLMRGDNVTTDVLVKICTALECTMDDIMEIVPKEE